MSIQSLAEAKAEIEALEKIESGEAPEKQEILLKEEPKKETLKLKKEPKVEKEEPEEQEESSDSEVVESNNEENTDWMKGDEEEESEKQEDSFSASDVAKVRRKFKGRLKAEKEEADKLREELAETKRQMQELATKAVAVTASAEPQRAQFKTDAEYQRALTLWIVDERENKSRQEQQVARQKQQHEQVRTVITQNVEAHYSRRAELAKKSGITEEAMGEAERNFRQAIEDIRPEQGDAIVDGLISMLGKGSEMVIHKLGVSRAAREKAAEALKNDPSGLSLAALLGELKASLTMPMKRESRAPEPAPQLQGDKANKVSHSRLMKDYENAVKSGDAQKQWDARKALKAAGADVSKL